MGSIFVNVNASEIPIRSTHPTFVQMPTTCFHVLWKDLVTNDTQNRTQSEMNSLKFKMGFENIYLFEILDQSF